MNILIVSPWFSPFLGVGALRMSSFVSYLLAQNDDVTVLKLCDDSYPKHLMGDKTIDGVHYIEARLQNKSKFLESAEIFYRKIDDVMKIKKFDVLVCSCGPFYTMLACEKACKKHGVFFVLDYRDLWIYHHKEYLNLFSKIRHIRFVLKHKKYEKAAVEQADLFVAVTPWSLDIMKEKYRLKASHLIFNGYDDTTLNSINLDVDKSHKNNTFTEICFFGKMTYYSPLLAKEYLLAVKNLITKGYKIKIIHISEQEPQTQSLLNEIQFPLDCYTCTGRLSYKDGMKIVISTDICAAVIDYKAGLGTKIFDYMYANKPIVTIAPDGSEFAHLLKGCENAYVFQNGDKIEQSIQKIIDMNIDDLDKKFKPEIYSRSYQNKKYREQIVSLLEMRDSINDE